MGMNVDKPANRRRFVATESEDGRWLTIEHKGQVVMTLMAPLGDKLYLSIDRARVNLGECAFHAQPLPTMEILDLPEQPKVEALCL